METEVDEDILIDNILEMRMTVDDFQERYPYIDWLSFINEILDPVMELSNTSYVQLIDDLVLHDVFRLINRTPKRYKPLRTTMYLFHSKTVGFKPTMQYGR